LAAELSKLKVPELKQRCKAQGLPVGGNKSDLVARLIEAAAAQQHQQQQEPQAAAAPAPAPAAAAPESLEDVSRDELLAELVVEVGRYAEEELLQCLVDRGLDTGGSRGARVQRLAQAIFDEE
jgi:hypothetical protein